MSTARFNTLQNAAGSKSVPVDTVVDGSAKAWVNFNGTGTVTIRRAFNVSSITDNGVSDYTVNFANAFADSDYAWAGTAGVNAAQTNWLSLPQSGAPSSFMTTTSLRVVASYVNTGRNIDMDYVGLSVFR